MAQACAAWRLYLRENWISILNRENAPLSTNPEPISVRQHRRDILRKWKDAPQEVRDEFIRRAREIGSVEDTVDYITDIPQDNFRRKLGQYPCILACVGQDDRTWEKLECCLKLDENLSPLALDELPPIIIENELHANFALGEFTRQFILEDVNFEMMGGSDIGDDFFYYHIIMVVDQQSFVDGTLLHVDFDALGSPDRQHRYSAIHSYLPWKWHHESSLDLWAINNRIVTGHYTNGHAPNVTHLPTMDLTRSIVDILVDEMRSRGVAAEDTTHEVLANEAVTTVNRGLLQEPF